MNKMNKLMKKKNNFNINRILGRNNNGVEKNIQNHSHGILMSLGMRIKILRQMSNLSVSEYCSKYNLDEQVYKKYEAGETIMPHMEIRNLVTKMFNNDIFCRSEWVEGYEKICPVYMNYNSINIKNLKINQLSDYAKILQISYGYKSLNPNNVIGVVADSLMGKLYKKGTIVVGEKFDLSSKDELNKIKDVLCLIETTDNKEFVRNITFNNGAFFCCSIDPVRQTVFKLNQVVHVAKVNFALHKDLLLDHKI